MKKSSVFAPVLAVCLLAAGCGSQTENTGSTAAKAAAPVQTAETAAAVTEAPAPAAAESVTAAEPSPEWVAQLPEAATSDQLFVVAGVGETTAYVSMHQKNEKGEWEQLLTTPGYIGKKGLGKTKEGDGKTPVGTYHFNFAFGIADDPGCAIEYHKATDDSYWSGDPREGFRYNQYVDIKDLPELDTNECEHIYDYYVHYQYCLNISYNEEGTPGLGSAIFLHCLGPQKPYTGGCVAIPQDKMVKVMQNVREDCAVVIGSLKDISGSTWEEWGL